MEIEKTNRMNALFEFYSTLLTEKQMNYMELYERKLHLFSDYIVRNEVLEKLTTYVSEHYPKDTTLQGFIEEIQEIDE